MKLTILLSFSIIFYINADPSEKSKNEERRPVTEITLDDIERIENEREAPPLDVPEIDRPQYKEKDLKKAKVLKLTEKGLFLKEVKIDSKSLSKNDIYELEWDKSLTLAQLYKSLPSEYRSALRKSKGKLYTKWYKVQKSEEDPPPTVDIFILKEHFFYQGRKRNLKQMKLIMDGVRGAMGEDVVIHLIVKKDITFSRLEQLLSVTGNGFYNIKNKSASDGKNPVLTTVEVENVHTNPEAKKDKAKK